MAAVRRFCLVFGFVVISNEDVEKIKWNKIAAMILMAT